MNCGLHSAAKGMEKNTLTMTFCCLGLQFLLKFQHVWHCSTEWWCDFVQATIVHCQSPFSIGVMHWTYRTIKGYQLLPSHWVSMAEGAVGCCQFWAKRRVWVMLVSNRGNGRVSWLWSGWDLWRNALSLVHFFYWYCSCCYCSFACVAMITGKRP